MKALPALAIATALGGCSMFGAKAPPAPGSAVAVKAAPQLVDANGVPIERVPYRVGVSSVTVEQLARQHACVGQGAGLVTEPGPVEVYRLQCGDGKVFMARCELRQCRKM
ncbi:hypothetical protein [Massilia litorea]|uniref:Lipoprotein n=1 Tax=Massilia litorea TaxID=2769491 RepID=A0A7L9UAF2_9BURK|nr:hypothetical protein [Massilia litorea]QOL51810.1 hypothetical protein LPB04_11490 [Massilia litorea]